MTEPAAVTRARPRSRFVAIVVYTLQSCIPPKRWFALLLPCAGALLFGLLAHAVNADTRSGRSPTSPPRASSRSSCRSPRSSSATPCSAPRSAPARSTSRGCRRRRRGRSCSVAGSAARSSPWSRSPRPRALAAVVAGASSSAGAGVRRRRGRQRVLRRVFIAIGCITRRTAVWSLAFVFLVERLLGAALTGIAQLSPTWESRAIFVGLHRRPAEPPDPRRHPGRAATRSCGW